MLQLPEKQATYPYNAESSPAHQRKHSIPPCCYHSRLPNPFPVEKCQFRLVLATQNSSPGRELTRRNLLDRPDLRERSPQTVLFQTRQGQNKPGSAIGAGDLRSHTLHVDLHADLHHVENSRPADSGPVLARLTRISFNWRGPPPKNLKSS